MRQRKIGFPMEFTPENLRGFIMLSKEDLSKAIVSKLTASQWKLWMYLMMIDSFADKTRDGELIYKDIPSPQQISTQLGLNYHTVVKDLRHLRKLGFYDYRITGWQGFNYSADNAKSESHNLKTNQSKTHTKEIHKTKERESETIAGLGLGLLNPNERLFNPLGRLNNPSSKMIADETLAGYGLGLFNPNGGLFNPNERLFNPNERLFNPLGEKKEAETVTVYGLGLFNPNGGLFNPNGGLFNPLSGLFNPLSGLFNPKFLTELSQSKGFSVPQTIQTNQTFSYSPDRETQENEIQLHNQINNNNQEVQQYSESLPQFNQTSLVNTLDLNQDEIFPVCDTKDKKEGGKLQSLNEIIANQLQKPLRSNNPQSINWQWLPDGTWKTAEGKLDPNFHEWLAQEFIKNFGTENIYKAKADVLSYFRNDPCKLPIRWEQYHEEYLAKTQNIKLRLDNHCQISPEQQQQTIARINAVNSVDDSMSVSSRKQETENIYTPVIEAEVCEKTEIYAEDEYGWKTKTKDFTGCHARQEEIPVNPKAKELIANFLRAMRGEGTNSELRT